MPDVRIALRPDGRGRIEVDGYDLSDAVTSLTVHSDARAKRSAVNLVLVTYDTVIDGAETIGIPERTEKALLALGWTPPPEPDR